MWSVYHYGSYCFKVFYLFFFSFSFSCKAYVFHIELGCKWNNKHGSLFQKFSLNASSHTISCLWITDLTQKACSLSWGLILGNHTFFLCIWLYFRLLWGSRAKDMVTTVWYSGKCQSPQFGSHFYHLLVVFRKENVSNNAVIHFYPPLE